jgi:hypothetical protein
VRESSRDAQQEPQSEKGVSDSALCGLQVHKSTLILGYNMKHAGEHVTAI